MLDSLQEYASIMVWSYYTRNYSDCRPFIVLSVLGHVKHVKAVYRVKTETNSNLNRKYTLNYWHRCNHRCKRRLVYEIDLFPLNFSQTTVYAHIGIACDGPKIRMCARSDNTAMTTDLMVI